MSALRKVLVVDDDPVVGKSFDRILSKDKGYVVIKAENAAQALEKLREQEYDVIFTDIRMPGMDGVELAERVKARRPWTPVVIVTGYGTTENEERAKAAGVSAFLNKPLSPEMIEESALHALREPAPSVAVQEVAPSQGALPDSAQNGLTTPAPMLARVPAVRRALRFLQNVALFLAAPFVGLVYAVSLPLVGLAMLVWIGVQAYMKKSHT